VPCRHRRTQQRQRFDLSRSTLIGKLVASPKPLLRVVHPDRKARTWARRLSRLMTSQQRSRLPRLLNAADIGCPDRPDRT
jgi:hypothetical protein